MDKFVIKGGSSLSGKVSVSGAKNASLALLPAAILANGNFTFNNTPHLNDVYTMVKLLTTLGINIVFTENKISMDTSGINSYVAPYEHVKKMRASVYVLGPLLARFGQAKVSLPGGCAWGPRPINLHLEGLKKMGADISLEEGYIVAKSKKLAGCRLSFDVSSVGATGNLMMAATLAKGVTEINNAAIEPEISNLAQMLIQMGAKIEGINTPNLLIEGVDELHPTQIDTIPDRIEAGTLLIAAALTGGSIKIENIKSNLLEAVLVKLEDSGCSIVRGDNYIELKAPVGKIIPTSITTSIFPGFPTDMQAQWTAYMSVADGISEIVDNIYIDRFKHIPELERLGANIDIHENRAIVKGVSKLNAAKVMSTDLRASASLVLAGLIADGATEVLRVYHLDRGYQSIEKKLQSLGASIERVEGSEY